VNQHRIQIKYGHKPSYFLRTVLGYYAMSNGISIPTFRYYLSFPKRR